MRKNYIDFIVKKVRSRSKSGTIIPNPDPTWSKSPGSDGAGSTTLVTQKCEAKVTKTSEKINYKWQSRMFEKEKGKERERDGEEQG
jgi:hypothetical protein